MSFDRAGSRSDRQIPAALLAYAVALAVFLLVPPFLRPPAGVPGVDGFTLQEAADLLTPILVIPLAWLALERAGSLGRGGILVFLVIAAVWVEAQGIHLGTNAIGDAFPDKNALHAFYATKPGILDEWLDETLSHWMWHVAWVALSFLLMASATRSAWPALGGVSVTAAVAGVIHGVVFFFVTVEGVTAALGIPASVVLLAWSASASRRGLGGRPVPTFFLVASAITLAGYIGWAALNGWTLPEFSKVLSIFDP